MKFCFFELNCIKWTDVHTPSQLSGSHLFSSMTTRKEKFSIHTLQLIQSTLKTKKYF